MSEVLCRAADIVEGSARSFITGEGANRRDIVVVRKQGQIFAYVNSCPHQGTPLETFPDKFLNEDGTLFVCSTHGARFRVADGHCVSGPCEGKSMVSIAVSANEGRIELNE